MDPRRVTDWLIGAAGMLGVLVVATAVLWWTVTEPADEPATNAAEPPAVTGPAPDGRPPAGLDPDQVWLDDLHLQAGTVLTARSPLRDVRATGRDVVTGPDGLVAEQVRVEATVPFGVVADELGGDSVVRAAEDGQATVVRTVEALGREWRVVATGSVEVVGGRLVVEPSSIDLGGPDFLASAVASVVRRLVTVEHELEGLPEGLVLRDVTVRSDGFRVDLRGEDVALVGQ